jgi:hypothetical protein
MCACIILLQINGPSTLGGICCQMKIHSIENLMVLFFQWSNPPSFLRHVLKGETSKRNDRNETTETTETTETKRPKRNDRNETTETKQPKRPKRNDRNETTETNRPKRPKRNGRKYKLQEKWKILKYEIYGKFY